MIRLVLVDDQALARAGLKLILAPEDGFQVVGEAADGAAALAVVAEHRPDVVVMDVRMRGMDGVEATRRLKADPHSPPVLILTTFDDDEVLSGALRAGAAGFMLKEAPAEELIRAVRPVAADNPELTQDVSDMLLRGALGNDQPGGDLRVGGPLDQQGQHLQLARAERIG